LFLRNGIIPTAKGFSRSVIIIPAYQLLSSKPLISAPEVVQAFRENAIIIISFKSTKIILLLSAAKVFVILVAALKREE